MRIEPEEDARRILYSNEYNVRFFDSSRFGLCFGVNRAEMAQIIMFSPDLYDLPPAVFIGVAAHELAHLFLKHFQDNDNYHQKEQEADQQAIKWGFERELRISQVITDKVEKLIRSRFPGWGAV